MGIDYREEYSIEAEVAKAMYIEKDYTCFVEGKDDINFWQSILKKIGIKNLYLRELKGIDSEKVKAEEKIEKQLSKLKGENDYLIFLDKDFRKILGCYLSKDYNVVYTYGYSIENTICCKKVAKEILKSKLRVENHNFDLVNEINDYIEKKYYEIFEFEEGILVDILNRKKILDLEDLEDYKPINVYLDSEHLILDKNLKIKKDKETEWKEFREKNFTIIEVEEIKKIIDNHVNFLRGHFLQHYFNKIIEKKLKEKKSSNIRHDDIFLMAIDKCGLCDEDCKQINYYFKKINEAYSKLKD